MIKKSEMTFTSAYLKSYKLLLTVCAAASAAVDAVIISLLAGGGFSGDYLICPCILLGLDALFIALSLTATNYRFKYSLFVWILYSVLFAAVFATGFAIVVGGEGTVITNGALAAWSAIHIFSIAVTVVTALYASRLLKNKLAAIVVSAAFVALGALYCIFACAGGFFGQGNGWRGLIYKDDGNGGYRIIGVMAGNEKRVEINGFFNGKKVSGVDCKIFAEKGVTEYAFSSSPALYNSGALTSGDLSDKKIFAVREHIDGVRKSLFGCATLPAARNNALALANSAVPCGLEDNEVYAVFNYNSASYEAVNGEYIGAYICEKGSQLNARTYAKDFGYVKNSAANNVSDLDWCYKYYNKMILKDMTVAGNSILDGAVISENTAIDVTFEKIARVYFKADNDSKYVMSERQPDLASESLGGTKLGFRYVSESTADGLLQGLETRKGFDLEFQYASRNANVKRKLDGVAKALQTIDYADMDLYPVWTLQAPALSVSSTAQNGAITYGDGVTFTAAASHEATGVYLVYEWTHGSTIHRGSVWNKQQPSLSGGDDGAYTVSVTAKSDTETSLTAQSTETVNLKINKKTLSFGWNAPAKEESVYDGLSKRVAVSFDVAQLVHGDALGYTVSLNGTDTGAHSANVIDAGTYSFSVGIDAASALNYKTDGTAVFGYTVSKRPVAVNWGECGFDYNGYLQAPLASATGVDGKQLINTVLGAKKDAGSYVATAYTSNGNYELINYDAGFVIRKIPLRVTARNVLCNYGDTPVAVGADFVGFVGADTSSSLGGSAVYTFANQSGMVGDYLACVRVGGYTSPNYNIEYVAGDLSILRRTVVIKWVNDENLVYDASRKNVSAVVANKVSGDEVNVEVTGGNAVNAGDYVVTAQSIYGDDAANYELTASVSRLYTIEKAPVTIAAEDVASVYGEPVKPLTARVSGEIYNNEVDYELNKGLGTAAGSYLITVKVFGNELGNYAISVITGKYVISPRVVTVHWSGYENLVYDGAVKTVNAVIGNTVEGDDVRPALTGNTARDAGDYTAQITLTGDKAGNYSLPSNHALPFSVARADLNLTLTVNDFTYGMGATPALKISGNLGGGAYTAKFGVFPDEAQASLTINSKYTVGEYYAFVTVVATRNFNGGKATAAFSVNRRSLTLKWNGNSGLIYNSAAKNVTATLSNAVSGDDVSVTVSNGARTAAGTYRAEAALSGKDAFNYAISGDAFIDYVIAKAPVTISAGNYKSVYGEQLKTLSATVSGRIYNGELTYKAVKAAGTDAGEYAVTVETSGDENYDVTKINGVYVIEKAQPAFAWAPALKYTVKQEFAVGDGTDKVEAVLPAAPIGGAYSWREEQLTKLGENKLLCTFTPTDKKNYNSVSLEITVTAKRKPDLTVTFSTVGDNGISVELIGGAAKLDFLIDGNFQSGAITVTVEGATGKSSFTLSSKGGGELNFDKTGVYTVTFDYGGDAQFLKESKSFKITVVEGGGV